jgi:hypothetical protein
VVGGTPGGRWNRMLSEAFLPHWQLIDFGSRPCAFYPCARQRDIFTSYRKKNSSMTQDFIGAVRKRSLVKEVNSLPLSLNRKTRIIAESMCRMCLTPPGSVLWLRP